MGGHGPPAEIDLCQVLVVGPTEKGDPVRGVVAAQGEGVAMVELEPLAGRATPAFRFSVTAASITAAKSPSGTEERMRVRSRSSLSRSSVLAVNWTL